MIAGSLYAVVHGNDTRCPKCGKIFYRTEDWVYKERHGSGHTKFFCSWKCFRAAQSEREGTLTVRQRRSTPMKERVLSHPMYLTQDERARIIRMYNDGMGAKAISHIIGRSLHAVQCAIRREYGEYHTPGKKGTA